MPYPIPLNPTPATLSRLATRRLVSHAHALRWANELAHRLGGDVEVVASARLPDFSSNVTPTVCTLFYWPSPYVLALRVQVEFYGQKDDERTCEIDVAGGDFFDEQAAGLDGTEEFTTSYNFAADNVAVGYKEVASFTPDALNEITVTRTPLVGNTGIRTVTLCEVPLAATDVANAPATNASFNPATCLPPQRILDGSASTERGFARMLAELAKARAKMRRHLQWVTHEDTVRAEQTTSTSFVTIFAASGVSYRFRARRLYTTSEPNAHHVAVRYQATGGATLRLVITPVGGSPANVDVPLAATGGVFTTLTPVGSVNISTSGTGEEFDVELQLKATSGTAYVSTVALIEAET